MPDHDRISRQDGQINDLATFQSCLGVLASLALIATGLYIAFSFANSAPGGFTDKVIVFGKWCLLMMAAIALLAGSFRAMRALQRPRNRNDD